MKAGGGPDRLPGALVHLLVGDAEVPFEDERLALGVAHDALPVAAELGVVGREQEEPGLIFEIINGTILLR